MMDQQSFGYWLRRRRKTLDLTREGLADRVGCSAATIRKLEDEERRPSAQMAGRLAEIFEIPLAEQASFLRFARGGMLSVPAEAVETWPWRSVAPQPANLPATVTSLIGREKEIAEVCDYLSGANIRLMTLIGPPGIGKTHLGIEVARAVLAEFPAGVFFVALARLDEPALIPLAILQSLGYIETKNQPALQQIVDGVGDKRLLLVLDNCEQFIAEISSLVSSLISICPRLTILVTSRETLRIPGEWLYTVPALEIPAEDAPYDRATTAQFPSLLLFAERARAVRADFAINADNFRVVSDICTRLDGLPLAIELIASRIRLMSPQMLLERLNDQFVLSANGMRAIPARQKTLGNAIGWSYHSLPADEQKLFASLAVFSGGFTLSEAEVIFASMFVDRPSLDLLMALSDKSLLQRVVDPQGEVRFSMLVTIRQFALDRFHQLENEAEVRNRHLACFIDLAERGTQELRGSHQVAWAERLENELDNFRSALEWSTSSQQTEAALRLLGALGWPWEVRGHYYEARTWLERIRKLPDVNNHPLRFARVLNHIGRHNWTQERAREARSLLEESCAIALEMGEPAELCLAEALNWLGLVIATNEKDFSKAHAIFERSLELNKKWKDERGIALSTFHLGICESFMENDATALSLLETSMSLFRQFGDLFFVARDSLFIGYIFLRQKNYAKSRELFEEHLRLDTQIQFWDGIADGWRNLAISYQQEGLFEQASQCIETCIEVCREHSLNKNDAFYISGLLALYLDRYTLADQSFTYLLKNIQKSGEKTLLGRVFLGMAAIAAGRNQPERAARLSGAEQAIMARFTMDYPDADRAEMERHIQIAHMQLGEIRFQRYLDEGQAMTQHQALELAGENGVL